MRSDDEQAMILFLANKNYQGPKGTQFMGQIKPQPKPQRKEPPIVGGVGGNGQIFILTGAGVSGPTWMAYSRPCTPKPAAAPVVEKPTYIDVNRKPKFTAIDDKQSDNDQYKAQPTEY
jgi:hypothetical protein